MIFLGFIGYILRKIEYDPSPFILGMVLGPMAETSFRQSLTISRGNPAIFFQKPFFSYSSDYCFSPVDLKSVF